jgi:hypothetical protein
MRRIGLLCLPLTLLACADPVGESLTAPVAIMAARDGGVPQNFQTHLAGDNEVPARETLAQGNAKFQLAPDGQSIEYKLIASNIENAFMAHIHLGAPTANGGVVVWLFNTPPGTVTAASQVRHDGVLAVGTITAANFVGALAGQPMSALLTHIRNGNAYVNVHTRDLDLAATALQAGNFPGGEVRGQIDHGSGM